MENSKIVDGPLIRAALEMINVIMEKWFRRGHRDNTSSWISLLRISKRNKCTSILWFLFNTSDLGRVWIYSWEQVPTMNIFILLPYVQGYYSQNSCAFGEHLNSVLGNSFIFLNLNCRWHFRPRTITYYVMMRRSWLLQVCSRELLNFIVCNLNTSCLPSDRGFERRSRDRRFEHRGKREQECQKIFRHNLFEDSNSSSSPVMATCFSDLTRSQSTVLISTPRICVTTISSPIWTLTHLTNVAKINWAW